MTCREKMLCSFLLLFTLASCVSGPPAVDVAQSSYQAEEDHNVTMEWTFFTRTDGSLDSISIFCELSPGLSPYVLFDIHQGFEVLESRHKHFARRVQFDRDALKKGLLRLRVSRLRTNDSGVYECHVNAGYGLASKQCHLKVTAARDRTKPETPSTTSGGGDPSPAGSPSQPESWTRIVFECFVGLLLGGALVSFGLCLYYCLRRKQDSEILPTKIPLNPESH